MLKDFLMRAGWMTKLLVAISVVVSIVTLSGTNSVTDYFTFNWELILQGQVHRLVTPIFLHFMIGSLPIHLIFNMMWLWDLGGSIEKERGPWYLLGLVLVIGIASNMAQYFAEYLMEGYVSPRYIFGGMSGVVYGLLGFIFMRRKFDPFFRVELHPGIMQFMMIWLVLGFVLNSTGMMGIANAAHLIGLVSGGALGVLTSKIKAF
ncbi:rhomboid family intramembrane serine protease [Kangiella marina]|uniref:Peptidase S54 rhomboid domain-containing protein n=1 Tax=Kangiella marina TaxID=1079178 RepID=A0ABP8IJY8_9GAMM